MSAARGVAATTLVAVVLALTSTSPWAATAGAQDDPAPGGPPSTAPAGTPTSPGITTTTLPEDNSELGRIIPLPNSGREPETPGDRGGWQQVTLFFAICAVILGIALYVWWRSRRTRTRLRAGGLDRVEWARSHGGDVRRSDGHAAG